ncbi:alpha-amylase family glycosyl hydrolase [Spirosoma pollinicola]|uniref:1,4-alpha-glucan branching enzyme n=1 Tax=Spirosoma pollinicola TaxID=2057025 RepID=A0A2K8Z380_9BACT|nr:alpha-amylase family glycosyl hydrolase [Spirosoma pollinicola]AUD04337.1 hypothetical protein CWM47_22335 [Spirosoma pollinicola]
MFVLIHAFSRLASPGLYVWRSEVAGNLVAPFSDDRTTGWSTFQVLLDPQIKPLVQFKLVGRDSEGKGVDWELDDYNRELKRLPDDTFPAEIWIFHNARRILDVDPMTALPQSRLTVHLITLNRYRESQLCLSDANAHEVRFEPGLPDNLGPVFTVDLTGLQQQFFYFRFVKGDKVNGNRTDFEPPIANKVYVADDGNEIWVHSDADIIRDSQPVLRQLTVHVHKESDWNDAPEIHLWQPGSGFEVDLPAEQEDDGWSAHRILLYTNIEYRFYVRYRSLAVVWQEPNRAHRRLTILQETECWTIEGDDVVFDSRPARDLAVTIRIAARPAGGAYAGPFQARVGVLDAGGWSESNLTVSASDSISFSTYQGIALKLDYMRAGTVISSHRFDTPETGDTFDGFSVLSKPIVLREAPPAALFADPPFTILRPGIWEQAGTLHFALHVQDVSRARLKGAWTNTLVDLSLTNDGTFFWAQIPITDIAPLGTDYHKQAYNYILNDDWLIHDPAAQWVEGSTPGKHSLLFNPDRHQWRSYSWQRPGWEYLIIYQIHPARFSDRHPELSPLLQVAREIDEQAGHLRDLGVTAIELLPVNEVGSPIYGWGYDPAFFFAVEANYGGPADLQELADTCHAHGIALILDVEFNHTGNTDNILFSTAHDTFIDGDTQWGPLINFDNPICRFFFRTNLIYLAETFRIDGFRFDHTDTIINGHKQQGYINVPGSGGGWEFLNDMRQALKKLDPNIVMIAEELPNDWYLTSQGAMDSQWCDDFHDRMVDVCRRRESVFRLGQALELTNPVYQHWYSATNYAESHDEVGNEDNRIAKCAEFGSGLRLAKVALATVLLGRGLPHIFMGGEAGETRQFAKDKLDTLPLAVYRSDVNQKNVLAWFQILCGLRKNDSRIKGPSPLNVRYADGNLLAFSRGGAGEFFIVLNFGTWSGSIGLSTLNLPDGVYCELWNSTWPAFAISGEWENEHTNWGRDARLSRNNSLNIPDFGVVVLERV